VFKKQKPSYFICLSGLVGRDVPILPAEFLEKYNAEQNPGKMGEILEK